MVAPANSYSTALKLFQSGQFVEAQRRLGDVVKSNPQQAEAWHLLGVIEFHQSNFEAAVKHFHRAVQIEECSAKYLTNLGSAWHAAGDLSKATDCFERAVTADPHCAESQTYLGIIRLQQGDLDAAESCLQSALLDAPQSWQARLNLGNLFRERRALDQAVEQYELALSIEPDSAESLLNLGELRMEQGRPADAIPHLHRAAALRPRVAEIQFRLADALRDVGDHTAAALASQRGLSYQASSFDGWIGLGISSAAIGKWSEAISSFRNAVSLQPNSPEAHTHLAEALQQSGDSEEAARHLAVAKVLEMR